MREEKLLIGLDIGGTKCAVVLGRWESGHRPQILARAAFATRESPEPGSCLPRMAELAVAMLTAHHLSLSDVAGVGISCGGPLDSRAGIILSPPNLPGWDEVPVIRIMYERLGVPVRLQNDANACALAEWLWGAAQGTQTAVFLTCGTGLGAGLVIDGRLHTGVDDLAGEIGHWRLAEDGPQGYGKNGSFEGFCSGGGLSRLARQYLQATDDVRTLADAARCGDTVARQIFKSSGERIGQGLALVIDLLNPEAIVLGSVFVRCEDLLRPSMEAVLEREVLPAARRRCRVVPALLGEHIGDYAAFAVAKGDCEKGDS